MMTDVWVIVDWKDQLIHLFWRRDEEVAIQRRRTVCVVMGLISTSHGTALARIMWISPREFRSA